MAHAEDTPPADQGQCEAQAYSVVGPALQQLTVYRACMRGKGWRQVE